MGEHTGQNDQAGQQTMTVFVAFLEHPDTYETEFIGVRSELDDARALVEAGAGDYTLQEVFWSGPEKGTDERHPTKPQVDCWSARNARNQPVGYIEAYPMVLGPTGEAGVLR